MIYVVSYSIDVLMIIWKRLRVRMYNGIDKICMMGLMNVLIRLKIIVMMKMMVICCSVVLLFVNCMFGMKRVIIYNVNLVIVVCIRKGIIV